MVEGEEVAAAGGHVHIDGGSAAEPRQGGVADIHQGGTREGADDGLARLADGHRTVDGQGVGQIDGVREGDDGTVGAEHESGIEGGVEVIGGVGHGGTAEAHHCVGRQQGVRVVAVDGRGHQLGRVEVARVEGLSAVVAEHIAAVGGVGGHDDSPCVGGAVDIAAEDIHAIHSADGKGTGGGVVAREKFQGAASPRRHEVGGIDIVSLTRGGGVDGGAGECRAVEGAHLNVEVYVLGPQAVAGHH